MQRLPDILDGPTFGRRSERIMSWPRYRFDAPSRTHRRGAFSLLEVILALTLIIIMMSGVFGFFQTVLRSREEGSRATLDAMRARALLVSMVEEIRSVAPIVPGDGYGFRGKKDSITIVRLKLPENYSMQELSLRETPPPAQMDVERISYSLLWDDEYKDEEGVKWCHGLWRSLQRTFDPNPQFVLEDVQVAGESTEDQGFQTEVVTGDLVAPEIKYVRFKYFDGAEWRDRWQVPFEEDAEDAAETEGLSETNPPVGGGASGIDAGDIAGGRQGGHSGTGDYALPQAVRITIGRERVDPDDEFQLKQEEEEEELGGKPVYHPDRFTAVVYLQQADPTLLSSRIYGVENDPSLQLGGQ
ncbi:MAG: type II secretion system protein [Phycisphaerales bacterium]|nr:type II secretion system protein [Phycisphaerales bacterium]